MAKDNQAAKKKPAIKTTGKISVESETVQLKAKTASKKTVAKAAPKAVAKAATKVPLGKSKVAGTKGPKGETGTPRPAGKPLAASKSVVEAIDQKPDKKEKETFKAEPRRARPATVKRNFMLLNADLEDIGKYTGKSPRQAALKIANTGVVDITIRETGKRRVRQLAAGKIVEYKVHRYTGSRVLKHKGENDPEWMPEMVNVPHTKKVCSEWIQIARNADN